MLVLEHFGLTDAGKVRQNNEDALLAGEGRDETLFAVADGIGGFEAGEVASSIAVDTLKDLEPGTPFEEAIGEANRRILQAARGDEKLSGMGTTVVAVRFGGRLEEPRAEVAHVGDSRAYLMRGGELTPLTEDHSFVAQLVRSGSLTREQASNHPKKNLITRALGNEEDVEVDTSTVLVAAGDRLVLCSDGLSDMVPEEKMRELLVGSFGEPETPARRLLSAALDAGGNDNVTVIVVDIREHEEPEPAEERAPEDRSPEETRREGTAEMPAVPPAGSQAEPRPGDGGPNFAETRGESAPAEDAGTAGGSRMEARAKRRSRRRRKRGGKRGGEREGRGSRAAKLLVRWLAVAAVVALALAPAYLWAGSRYFLGLEGGEVVAYRGLPYAPFGVELSEEWQRPGIQESDIAEPYREPVEEHRLYSRDEAEQVLRDLGRDG